MSITYFSYVIILLPSPTQQSSCAFCDFIFSLLFSYHLGPHTFELVTASKVLHVRATTSYEVSSWIEAIKVAIGKSYLGINKNLDSSQITLSPLTLVRHTPLLPFFPRIISL